MEERIDIKGMNCSRWRCSECYRGMKWHDTKDYKFFGCEIHGRINNPIDIREDPKAQITAAEIRLFDALHNGTIPKGQFIGLAPKYLGELAHEKTGIDPTLAEMAIRSIRSDLE